MLIEFFLKEKNKGDCESDKTIINYRIDLLQFEQFIKNTKGIDYLTLDNIKDITMMDLSNYTTYLAQCEVNGKKYSDASRARKIMSLKSLVTFLEENGIIQKGLGAILKTPKQEKKDPVYLEIEEAFKLIEGIKNIKTKAMVVFLLNTGLRISELLSIKITDIQPDFCIEIDGKGKKRRRISLNESCVKMLQQYLQEYKFTTDCTMLFPNNRGQKMTERNAWVLIKKEAKNIIGKDNITPHKLRHSFCTIMVGTGMNHLLLQQMMGHEQI